MYHESGNHAEAVKALQHAVRLNSSLFVPQLLLGLEYLQSNKAEAALPYLENAVKLNPQRRSVAALACESAFDARRQPNGPPNCMGRRYDWIRIKEISGSISELPTCCKWRTMHA